jgi:hypothetical protein
VVKRKMSNFKLKRAEHLQPPKPQAHFRDAVVVQPPPMPAMPPKPAIEHQDAEMEISNHAYVLI